MSKCTKVAFTTLCDTTYDWVDRQKAGTKIRFPDALCPMGNHWIHWCITPHSEYALLRPAKHRQGEVF